MKYKVLVGYKEKFSTRLVEAENEDAAVEKAVKQFIKDYRIPEYALCLFNVQGELKSIFQGTVPAPFYAERNAPFEITRLDFNIDRHPFVGFKDVSIEAIARDDLELSPYYDNWPGYPQVTEVTRGKRYHIYKVEGHGDVFDAFFLNDRGEEQSEPSYLFKDAE